MVDLLPRIIIFLDDSPERASLAYQRMPEEARERTIWCKTALECIITLRDYWDRLESVSLDHDLGGKDSFPMDSRNEESGMQVVRYIEELSQLRPGLIEHWKKEHVMFTIHSWNVYSALQMKDRLQVLGLTVRYKPFGTNKII